LHSDNSCDNVEFWKCVPLSSHDATVPTPVLTEIFGGYCRLRRQNSLNSRNACPLRNPPLFAKNQTFENPKNLNPRFTANSADSQNLDMQFFANERRDDFGLVEVLCAKHIRTQSAA
jgi:hypothetical protein